MPLFTVIQRVTSPLILAESMDTDSAGPEMDALKKDAKALLDTISRSGESSAVFTSGNYYFIHLTENGVCYLTLCDKSYPKKLAYSFLEELKKEFDVQHGSEVSKTKRPFAFELFDTFIQKTKKLYMDTKSQRNLNKVTSDLKDINKIMQRSVTDILSRSAKFSDVAARSHDLGSQASKYEMGAKKLHSQYFWRTYGPIIGGGVFILLLLLFKFLWF